MGSDTYGFEFAFRLDEPTRPDLVHRYLTKGEPESILSSTFGPIKLRRRGGSRVERISPDTTLVKVHSVAVARLDSGRHARFEIIVEIMGRRISDHLQYFLRQLRVFGDSPEPLPPEKINDLLRDVLMHICRPLVPDDYQLNIDEILEMVIPVYTGKDTVSGESRLPRQQRRAKAGQRSR